MYPNTLYAVKVNGAQVKEWLEMSAGQFNQIDPTKTEEQPLVNIGYPTYNFDILDGLKYEIDVTQPAKYDKDGKVVNANANRIVNMTYEGKPVADNQEFIVATNNYRGSSKTFPGVSEGEVIYQSQDETRQIIVKYMQETPVINPTADKNWTFKPIVADKLNTTFDSSPNAQKYIKKDGKISYVGPSENEFAKYAIDITKKNDDKETGEGNPTTPPKVMEEIRRHHQQVVEKIQRYRQQVMEKTQHHQQKKVIMVMNQSKMETILDLDKLQQMIKIQKKQQL